MEKTRPKRLILEKGNKEKKKRKRGNFLIKYDNFERFLKLYFKIFQLHLIKDNIY